MANSSLPEEFVPYNYFFGAHHRKAKVSNLFHANLCSFSLLVIVSRLIPLAMHFPGIKRNKYSSVVIDLDFTASLELHGNLSRNKSKLKNFSPFLFVFIFL